MTTTPQTSPKPERAPRFGLIIVGDEILSGKRADKHLPSVDHPEYGRHIELGVKGEPREVAHAYARLLEGLRSFDAKLGPELVQKLECFILVRI